MEQFPGDPSTQRVPRRAGEQADLFSPLKAAFSGFYPLSSPNTPGIWHYAGSTKALEFFTGYLIEKSLSVDNVFVFALLFSYFAVPPLYQHKVLFWGILGALVMRAIMIVAGAV